MPSNREQINKEIANLKYDPKTVMVFNGTSIANVDLPTDKYEDSTYIVVTREKRSYEGDFDIAVPTAFNSITYPGALLVASNDLLDGKPQELAAEKAETTLTIDLPGVTENSFTTVPTYKNVTRELNGILDKWFKANKDKGGNIPANFQYNSSLVHDEHELALKFGCDVSYLKQKIGIDFKSKTEDKKSTYIVRFKQIFYTVSAERPLKPADIFAEKTSWEELTQAGINKDHPPLFVKSVQYGRQIFLKFESSLSATELESTLKGTVSKDGLTVDAHASAEYKTKLSKIDVNVVALGGSSDLLKDLELDKLENIQKINKVIFENTGFTAENPAAPLNYYCVYLKDGVSAGVFGKTEYIDEKTERFTGGELKLDHSGAYVAKFHVNWDAISYDKGIKKITRVGWEGNGKDRTAHFATVIPFRGNVRNIEVKAEGCTGLAWEWWRTSGHKVGLPLVPNRKVSIGGTTLHQSFKMEPSD